MDKVVDNYKSKNKKWIHWIIYDNIKIVVWFTCKNKKKVTINIMIGILLFEVGTIQTEKK